MSIEAMAMAGMDYKECGINFEEWDRHCRQQPPLYLEDELSSCSEVVDKGIVKVERMKEKLREWAKAVASEHKSAHFTSQMRNALYSVVSQYVQE